MKTVTAYDTHRGLASESATGRVRNPPSVMTGIRAALVARGSSLRQWAYAWATQQGVAQDAAYHTLRMAIQRRLERRRPPLGRASLRIVQALRADLGASLVPDFDERGERND